jgi:hypothetical protein
MSFCSPIIVFFYPCYFFLFVLLAYNTPWYIPSASFRKAGCYLMCYQYPIHCGYTHKSVEIDFISFVIIVPLFNFYYNNFIFYLSLKKLATKNKINKSWFLFLFHLYHFFCSFYFIYLMLMFIVWGFFSVLIICYCFELYHSLVV